MMFENLAEQGIVQRGHPDLVTVRQYHPEAMSKLCLLFMQMGYGMSALVEGGIFPPGIVTSGYRDKNIDPAVKNSPHKFGIAFDLAIGNLDQQIKWLKKAISPSLFNRGGLYPDRGIIHVDIADDEWMQTYNGTRFWVCLGDKYTGFSDMESAINFAQSSPEGKP